MPVPQSFARAQAHLPVCGANKVKSSSRHLESQGNQQMILEPMELNLVFGVLVFLLGACLGSFLNVVAYRVPLEMSVVRPRSHCTQCQTPVPAHGLIPILGWFLVKAKCVKCKAPVSFLYPLVEGLTGAGLVFLFFFYTDGAEALNLVGNGLSSEVTLGEFRYGFVPPLLGAWWLFLTAVPLVIIDLRYRLLPDVITFPGAGVAFFIGSALPHVGWQGALLGILAGSGGLFAVAKSYELLRGREGLGMGDVKYLAMVGCLVGWQGVILTIALASFSGAIIGIVYGFIKKEGMQVAIPFGPFLAGAALVVYMWGDVLAQFFYG
jgi:leader peptidase (prepilin peptidase) / N-methyltransferase